MSGRRAPRTGELHELDGPLLLLAGPGTGKTYRLGKRIKYLLEQCAVDPTTITVITFTAAAAAGLRAKISNPEDEHLFLAADRQPKTVTTMHALGQRILTEAAVDLGIAAEPELVTSDHLRDILLADAAQLAGLSRAEAEATERCRRHGACEPDGSARCATCDSYGRLLRACGAIDFDDQIILACRVLRDGGALAAKYRRQAAHLLIDEYQDINAGQFELIRLLTEGQTNGLFAVGDDDQSIYSWRGGTPEFIRRFEKDFGPDARVEPLLKSFRCHRNVLEAALVVVTQFDPDRRPKGEFSYHAPDGPKVVVHNAPSGQAEASAVDAIVRAALPGGDVLILVPTRAHATLLADELRRHRIRFTATEPAPGDGFPILDRLGDWLRNEDDSLALRECIEAFIEASDIVPSKRVRTEKKKRQRELAMKAVADLWSPVIARKGSLWAALVAARRHEVLGPIHEAFRALKENGEKDVPGFLARAATALRPWRTTTAVLDEIANWTARATPPAGAEGNAQVRIMTFQGAKGLEADTVCVVGLEDGTVPRNGSEGEALAEWARLLYVSMTRAKRELHLFHARTRPGAVSFQALHGDDGRHTLPPSRFLTAIPEEFVEERFQRGAK